MKQVWAVLLAGSGLLACAHMGEGQFQSAKADNYDVEHAAKPPADSNTFAEGQAAGETLAKTALPPGSTPLRVYVTGTGWSMDRNKLTGAALGRDAPADIHFKDSQSRCWVVHTLVYEEEQGGSWGPPKSWSASQDSAQDSVGTPDAERASPILTGFTFTRESCASIESLPAPTAG